MTFNSTENRWEGKSEFTLVMGGSVHPDQYDAAISYEANKSGVLVYKFSLDLVSGESNGVTYSVYINNQKYNAADSSGILDPYAPKNLSLEIAVEKGDRVSLVIGNNGASAFDTTAVSISASFK
jgi:hypothetical protein